MGFRLFQAPLEEASEFAGPGTCSLCERDASVVFRLEGIRASVVVGCGACGAAVGLEMCGRSAGRCDSCNVAVPFPLEEASYLCESCLHGGRAGFTKGTELGMVRWRDARDGWTHGVPGFPGPEWETRPADEDDDWFRIRVQSELLLELVCTPSYPTIQEEKWLFCCRQPMAFLGNWSRERFGREAADGDGEALFKSIVEWVVPGLWEDELHDETGV